MSVQKDVTETTEAAQRSAYLAFHDTLTGLPNRAQLMEQLSLALARRAIVDVPRCAARDTAAAAAARYADALKLPFDVHGARGQTIEIGVSAGVALFPEDAATPAALLLAADADMYAGKRAGRAPDRAS